MTSSHSEIPVKWMSLESIQHKKYSPASDAFSFAVLAWEVFTGGETPWAVYSAVETVLSIAQGTRLPRPAGCPKTLWTTCVLSWKSSPEERPSFSKIVKDLNAVIVKVSALPRGTDILLTGKLPEGSRTISTTAGPEEGGEDGEGGSGGGGGRERGGGGGLPSITISNTPASAAAGGDGGHNASATAAQPADASHYADIAGVGDASFFPTAEMIARGTRFSEENEAKRHRSSTLSTLFSLESATSSSPPSRRKGSDGDGGNEATHSALSTDSIAPPVTPRTSLQSIDINDAGNDDGGGVRSRSSFGAQGSAPYRRKASASRRVAAYNPGVVGSAGSDIIGNQAIPGRATSAGSSLDLRLDVHTMKEGDEDDGGAEESVGGGVGGSAGSGAPNISIV